MRAWSVAFVSVFVLSACSDELPPPRTEKPTAPDTNDPAYAISGAEPWWIIGNKATPSDDLMQIAVTPPDGTDFIDAYVADLPVVRLRNTSDGRLGIQLELTEVPAGAHEILLSANGSTTAFAKLPLYRSAPYYVIVTTDWDFADPGDTANGYQDLLHRDHPQLVMTHFVGPYTFTDPAVTPARQEALVTWLKKQRDTFKDEIGLHIHPYCNFVTAAGVTCVTDQSTVYPGGDTTGYTIKLGAYGRTEMGKLLDHAALLFEQHGLGRPKTFRAGGWTATLETLQALADKGFVADTSALNWKRIEEWLGKELYTWNMQAWGPIDDTSQPYFPSETNVLLSDDPKLSILEVPDNGVMIDYVTLTEMNGLFDANWNGQPLDEPRTLMMGFHPATPGFSEAEYLRVNGFLKYADMKLANKHLGPVVYITLEDVVAAFTQ